MIKENLEFKYKFVFPDGKVKEFQIKLAADSLQYIGKKKFLLPGWTKLKFNQCRRCDLPPETKNCPVAVNLYPIMETFKSLNSFDKCQVILETAERTYSKHATLQQGISSMIGIIMATSGCPILSKLKPMVRFHLPFASPQENLYRAISMYLVQEYFKYKRDEKPDWDLHGLTKTYEKVHEVNVSFAKRLAAMQKDADVNALIVLDNLANYVNFSLDRDRLKGIEDLFKDL